MYITSDEELATLNPAYSDSKSVSETAGMPHDTEATHEKRDVPVTMIGVHNPRSWYSG